MDNRYKSTLILMIFLILITLANCTTTDEIVDERIEVTGEAIRWTPRFGHTSVVYGGRMWVIGGSNADEEETNYFNDVYCSEDGVNWIQTTPEAPWEGREGHTSVVFDKKIWIFGGYNTNEDWVYNYLKDIWYTENGTDWYEATLDAPWNNRSWLDVLMYDGKLWAIAGHIENSETSHYPNDIWSSDNGIDWIQETNTTGWFGRAGQSTIIYKDEFWMMGGFNYDYGYLNDIWNSKDGKNWNEISSSAPWAQRTQLVNIVYDGKLWMIGGYDGVNTCFSDVWNTADGLEWEQMNKKAEWTGRLGHTVIVYDDKIWVMGGIFYGDNFSSSCLSDVWSSTDGIEWTEVSNF